MKLRTRLVLLVVVAVVPLLLFTAVMVRREYQRQHQAVEAGMRDTVRALSLAVDREIGTMRAVLETLAESRYIDEQEFEAFYDLCAKAAAKREGTRIILFDLNGQQVINTLLPFGAALPNPFLEGPVSARDAEHPDLPIGGTSAIKETISTGRPVLSDVFMALSSRRPSVALNVPVTRHGKLLYVLDMSFDPEVFTRLLAEQRLPEDWSGVIVDRRGIIIARTRNSDKLVGRAATPSLIDQVAKASEGTGIGYTHENVRKYFSFIRSANAGWVTAIGVPRKAVDASLARTMLGWITGGGGLLLLGVIVALKLGKQISHPITKLARSAEALQEGKHVELEPSAIFEIAELQNALLKAAAAAQDAGREREQRVAAEAREIEAQSAKEKILEREASLRESEERLRILLGGIKDYAIFMLDPQGRIATWNPGAERLTGYSNDEALAGSLALLYDGEDKERRVVGDLRQAEHAPYEHEDWRLRKNGSRFRASISLSALRNDDGGLRGFACVIRDVSERARLEEDLKRHVEELTATERRKDAFLATLSHELRNPIAPIRNAVEILKAIDVNEPKFVWCRQVIEQQITHMARLMEDLLDVSRIMQNKLEVRKKLVDLRDIIRQAVATSSPEIEAAGHKLTVILPPETMLLSADPTRLTQVFVNLLNNAAKYMDKKGQIWLGVKVGAHEGSGGGKEAVIRLKDDGIGISPEQLVRIFEPFTQIEGAAALSRGGLGIGLALARHLIELHGGNIQAQSDGPGEGSEFIVRLPLVEAPMDAHSERSGTEFEVAGMPVFKRILVVDDARAQAQSLSMLLQVMGFEVRTAHDAAGALASAQEFHPDVALIDIGLPGANGYELAQRMRERPDLKDVVLIAQTGWGRDEDRERSRQAGFNYHLTKPIDHDLLEKILTGAVVPELTRQT